MHYLLKKSAFFFIYLSFALTLNINPEIGSKKSFSIPFIVKYSFNEHIQISHVNKLYHLEHPQYQYHHSDNSRNDITAITEISKFIYNKNSINLSFGRDYISNTSRTMFSSYSPSLDHFYLNLKDKKIDFKQIIIRLDNKIKECNESDIDCINIWGTSKHYINRWVYLHNISFKINNKLNFGIFDAIISSGENRELDWYYLTPFGVLQAEQLHNIQRKEGESYNNDNAFLGFQFDYLLKNNNMLFGEILIDDYKVDSGEENMNDVFGLILGIELNKNNYTLTFKYSYASPWLFTNSGLYTNFEHHGYPIGIRYPNSQSIECNINYKFSNSALSLFFYQHEIGTQTVTDENLNDNNPINEDFQVDYFDFIDVEPAELIIEYYLLNKKEAFPSFILTHNWMQSSNTDFILKWTFNIK